MLDSRWMGLPVRVSLASLHCVLDQDTFLVQKSNRKIDQTENISDIALYSDLYMQLVKRKARGESFLVVDIVFGIQSSHLFVFPSVLLSFCPHSSSRCLVYATPPTVLLRFL